MLDMARKRFFRHRQSAASSATLPPDCENTVRNQRGGPHLSAWGFRSAMGRHLKLGGQRGLCFRRGTPRRTGYRHFPLLGIDNMREE